MKVVRYGVEKLVVRWVVSQKLDNLLIIKYDI